MYRDDYQERIGSYDQALHRARQELDRSGGRRSIAPNEDELDRPRDVTEWAARHRVSPEELAVIHAQQDRERAMQAWEREMDAEDRMGLYGLIPVQRNESTTQSDNVITVDFARRTRVSRTLSRRGGR